VDVGDLNGNCGKRVNQYPHVAAIKKESEKIKKRNDRGLGVAGGRGKKGPQRQRGVRGKKEVGDTPTEGWKTDGNGGPQSSRNRLRKQIKKTWKTPGGPTSGRRNTRKRSEEWKKEKGEKITVAQKERTGKKGRSKLEQIKQNGLFSWEKKSLQNGGRETKPRASARQITKKTPAGKLGFQKGEV